MNRRRAALDAVIDAGVARATRRALSPKSIYLTAADWAAAGLGTAGDPAGCRGLPLRRVGGKGGSKIYCKYGIAVSLPRLGGRA